MARTEQQSNEKYGGRWFWRYASPAAFFPLAGRIEALCWVLAIVLSAIGLYLGKSGLNESFAAAGSLVVLVAWVYYAAQIFLLGAEFTRAFAEQHGSRKDTAANLLATREAVVPRLSAISTSASTMP